MTRERRRKCHHCGQLYSPDLRNRWHQQYCSEPACRQASKAASQDRWRASPEGRDYFRGTANAAAGAGLAEGPSGLLEEPPEEVVRVTRSLHAANPCPAGG